MTAERVWIDGGRLVAGEGSAVPLRHLNFPGAPQGLDVIVAQGAEPSRRGVAPAELGELLAETLPGRTLMRGADGQPAIRGAGGMHVSLSHAAGASALAVAPFAVGIDIECIDPDFDVLHFDPDVFGRDDFAFLQGLPAAARLDCFYRLWTLKEARLKRSGRNLSGHALPQILQDGDHQALSAREGSVGCDMSTTMVTLADRQYCLGVCWQPADAAGQ